jgi:hypothetical protein
LLRPWLELERGTSDRQSEDDADDVADVDDDVARDGCLLRRTQMKTARRMVPRGAAGQADPELWRRYMADNYWQLHQRSVWDHPRRRLHAIKHSHGHLNHVLCNQAH